MADEQALAQAVLEKTPTARPSATPEQQKIAEHAAKVRQNMPEDTLSALDASIEVSREVDVAAGVSALDSDFGIDRDAVSGAKKRDATIEPGSQARFDRANKAVKQVQELLDSGIITDRAGATARLEAVLSSLPGYDAFLASLPAGESKLIIDGLMRDPKFLDKARQGYEDWAAEGSRLKDEVTPARRKVDEAEAARVKKDSERIDVKGRLRIASDTKTQFETSQKAGSSTTPTLRDELDGLQMQGGKPRDLAGEARQFGLNVGRAQKNVEIASQKVDQLRVTYGPTNPRVKQAEAELTSAEKALVSTESDQAAAQARIQRRSELERMASSYQGDVDRLTAEETAIDTDYSSLELAALAAKADLALAQNRRVASEEARAASAERIMANALRIYIKEQHQRANEANIGLLDKMATEAKTKAEADLVNVFKTKYNKFTYTPATPEVKKFGIKIKNAQPVDVTPDHSEALKDAIDMMNPTTGGPEAKIKAELKIMYPDRANPTPPPATIEDPEVTRLMKDAAFVGKLSGEIALNAFTKYVQSGGQISDGQAEYIRSQPWGENMIESLLATPQVQAAEAELVKAGALFPDQLREMMKTKKGRLAVTALLMLAAGFTVSAAMPLIGIAGVASAVHAKS